MEFLDFSPVSPRLRKTLKGVGLRAYFGDDHVAAVNDPV
jgi:hypothetical protein